MNFMNTQSNGTWILIFQNLKFWFSGLEMMMGFSFKLGPNELSICKEFKNIGVIFSKNKSFYSTIKHNVDQAKKAIYMLYKCIRNLNLPIDLQLKIFDNTIVPILLYGYEIWGYQNTNIIENVHNEFLRNILKVK